MLQNEQISERVKKLILKHRVSDYYVHKNAHIPKSSFSRMINNTQEWKLQYVVSIATLFRVEIDWLLYGRLNHTIDELSKENAELKEEVLILREKVSTYEVAAKKASDIQPSKKQKNKKEKMK